MKTHDLSNDSADKVDNDSVHTITSEDPEGTRIVKQAMKAAQQSKLAGKSKAESHPADPRTMRSQDSKKSSTSKSKSQQVKTVRRIFSVKRRGEPLVQIPDHGEDSDNSTGGDLSDSDMDADLPPLLS